MEYWHLKEKRKGSSNYYVPEKCSKKNADELRKEGHEIFNSRYNALKKCMEKRRA